MIFCVEDDSAIRDLMIYTLQAVGFEAAGFANSGSFWEAVQEQIPQMVILDIMLPGEDGMSVLKKLRAKSRTADIPVILASAKGTEYDKVAGLDLGADDYLAKPFGMMEMVSRVKAVLRRTEPKRADRILRVGKLELDRGKHLVQADGVRVQLTRKEYELLVSFMKHPGLVFTREQMLSSVWGADFAGETRTVDVHIGTLRTKLGTCGEYIETIRGVGYRLEEKA